MSETPTTEQITFHNDILDIQTWAEEVATISTDLEESAHQQHFRQQANIDDALHQKLQALATHTRAAATLAKEIYDQVLPED